jgi:hypothetical protein
MNRPSPVVERRPPAGRPRAVRSASDPDGPPSAEAGSVTVEFAVVLPALLLVVAGCLGVLALASDAIRLADASGVAARAAGRGDDASMVAAVQRLVPGATWSVSRGEFVCVHLARSSTVGPIRLAVTLASRSCAPEAGA